MTKAVVEPNWSGNVVEEKELDTESERVEKLLDKPAIQTVAETVETPNDETVDNLDPIAVNGVSYQSRRLSSYGIRNRN
ncbi:hypothetical protein [Halobacterium sp. BOL4-2]|uniref:hypothetical protein n=1 Tax=Halobacterium sp. BOL4-2 TaxID=2810537 RepID=UPI001E6139E0|nr:hypothetical protein [Halobacterium sp. BOL4-2]UDF60578.1 hypothetical protein JRZ79_13600 [Halobacterium sp. BOL4-2]